MAPQWVKFKETADPLPIILLGAVAKGLAKYFRAGHDGKLALGQYGQFLQARWLGARDYARYRSVISRTTPATLLRWARRYHAAKKKLLHHAERLSRANAQISPSTALFRALLRYDDLCARAYQYVYDYVFLNLTYSEKLNAIVSNYGPDEHGKFLEGLAGLDKPTDTALAQQQLGRLVLQFKRDGSPRNVQRKVELFARRFGYLRMFTYFGEPDTSETIWKKIRALAALPEAEILAKTAAQIEQINRHRALTRHFLRKYRVSVKDRQVIRTFKEYAYISLYADELYHRVPYLMRPLLNAVADLLRLSYREVLNFTAEELADGLRRGQDLRELAAQRMQDFAFLADRGHVRILTGKALQQFIAQEQGREEQLLKLQQVKGQSAFPGMVQGVVAVLKGIEHIAAFPVGSVLVTTSTAPPYLPAMERSIAIVTNEGGLLSHAAIVSREFRKPCVVGTKIATKVFRDGDFVEVDATHGIVRKLNAEPSR